VAVPNLRVADPAFNAEQTIGLYRQAAERRAVVTLFPELGLSAYTCDDLFHQEALLDASERALARVVTASTEVPGVAVVGLPLRVGQLLYNCAAVVCGGQILGVVPKTYLPGYREYYEVRQFTPGPTALVDRVDVAGQRDVPFGTRLLFQHAEQPLLTFHVEICEDVWVPIPPSTYGAMAGATVLLNLSASNVTVGKDDYRRALTANQSARCLAAYLYSAAGFGESTTDLAWDGHALIYENGSRLAESERFSLEPQLLTAEVDLERLAQERMRQTSFGQNVDRAQAELAGFRTVRFATPLPAEPTLLPLRRYERFPYVPADPAQRDNRCAEVFQIQVQGLAKRLTAIGSKRVVIGVSGGLDSTHALLVCAQTMDLLGLPRENILAYTMPGFATGERTRRQAHRLMQSLGVQGSELDIRPSALQMLHDIGHPFKDGHPVYDVTFENVQAGERTSHLFRLANQNKGLVVGTGDLSELALGWATYGVGDQMSHYNVNASVPKTLIQYVIRWVADSGRFGAETAEVLYDVLATEISPELVPGDGKADGPGQSSEAVVGPYELQDFHLYYTLRYGFAPRRVAFLAYCAWHDREQGPWPGIPPEGRHEYSIGEIKAHLKTFLFRFIQLSQFKRSAIPNGPKVGSGGSLSPRGDWRAPSDAESAAWLADLELVPEEEPKARSSRTRKSPAATPHLGVADPSRQ
jgi:NAD+ synthase (glutamine-hydrolysing)